VDARKGGAGVESGKRGAESEDRTAGEWWETMKTKKMAVFDNLIAAGSKAANFAESGKSDRNSLQNHITDFCLVGVEQL